MFIHVCLLNGFSKPLLYNLPDHIKLAHPLGSVVRVPLRDRSLCAVIVNVLADQNIQPAFTVKDVEKVELFPQDFLYFSFLKTVAQYHQTGVLNLYARMRQFFVPKKNKKERECIQKLSNPASPKTITLTHEQQNVVSFVGSKLGKDIFTPTLLHGVTGSGKTEVYKKLILQALAQKKTVILLAPEVTLALHLTLLLQKQLPQSVPIFTFHSATSIPQKQAVWQELLRATPVLIIGVHMPILLPIANLGLIIVDEEHEVGYQEKKHPKINSKEAAVLRAHMLKIPILLGSATPSLSSLHNVKTRGWHFFQLKQRFSGAFPAVKTVILNNKKRRTSFWISTELENAIAACLQKKEQAIIFLNRRGFSFFVQCKECSFIFSCTSCSVSLTLHNTGILSCHYCGFSIPRPQQCSKCQAPERMLLKKGIGTQQVVTILEKLFPTASIARADLDTTLKKKEWQLTVRDFQDNKLDILVGTQTIAKGFHFPNVTLVGIIWADLNLHFPVYNATETALQQLIQVAGRAGRHHHNSTVIVQALDDHPVFAYLNEQDYLQFYAQEMESRTATLYPPAGRLAEIEIKHKDEDVLEREALEIAEQLLSINDTLKTPATILGPASPPIHMINKVFTKKIYLKSQSISDLTHLFSQLDKQHITCSLFFTPNPQ